MENEKCLSFNYMHYCKKELCYKAQTLCLLGGESNLGVIENSLMSLGGQKDNVSNKKTP